MKKILNSLLILVTVFALSLPAYTVYAEEGDDPSFDDFMTREFIETMESDYLGMHFTVKDYRKMGIEKPELLFGDATWESYAAAVEENQDVLDELHTFDYDKLSVCQQHDYDTIERYLIQTIELNKYPQHDQLFNPYTGVVNNIETNLTEFIFYTEEDFRDYLEVIRDIPEFLQEAIDVTKKQAEMGIFMTDAILEEGLDTINRLTEKKEDNELIVIFNESVDAFEGLSAADKESFKKQNHDTIINEVLPAFEHCAEELEKLRGSNRYEGGLANYPDGAAYYQALAQYKTSSNLSVQELLDLCTEYIDSVIDDYITLYYSGVISDDSVYEEELPERSPQEVLAYLQAHLQNYPEGPEVTYTSKYLDPSVANDATVAYYVNPPVDDIKANVIKINGDNISNSVDLYDTLAHEGFPGHLYQITWYLDKNPHPMRNVVGSIAYTEGWAMYTELEAFDFSELSEGARAVNKINIALGYVEDCAIDLGVNGLGWTVDDVKKYLQDNGLNAESAQSLYDFVLGRPGLLLPYGYGLLMNHRMRGKAMAALGDSFDIVDYHRVILEYGDRAFDFVEKDIDAYITSMGKEIPEEYGFMSLAAPTEMSDLPAGILTPETQRPNQTKNVVIYAGVGILLAAAAVFAFIRLRRKKEEDPFA